VLTAAGWAVGGYLLGGVSATVIGGGIGALGESGRLIDPAWTPLAAGGGALFALVAAALRASGSRISASSRALAVVGAGAMLVVMLVVGWRTAGEAFGVVDGAPWLVWSAVLQGAVFGWVTLAVGGARE
jgi:hypothetical protein